MSRLNLPYNQHYVRLAKEWDPSTGHIYDEYTLTRRDLNTGDFNSRWHVTRDPAPKAPKSRSLFDMALRAVLPHTMFMTRELLEGLPSGVLARIWRCLETKPVCLQDWKTFSSLLLLDEGYADMGLYSFHKSILRPAAEFKYYVAPMTSLTTDFITHLVIGKDISCVMSELLCLAGMKNLGILEMREPQYDQGGGRYPYVTDNLIQSWAEMDNPFPLLRVLKMHGNLSMTVQSLTWVSKFPSLAVYDVAAPAVEWGVWVEELRWEFYDDRVLHNSLARELVAMAHGSRSDETRARHGGIAKNNTESKLHSDFNDRHCRVRLVAHGQAPRLTDQLVSPAAESIPHNSNFTSQGFKKSRRDPISCVDFWRYALIGQLTNDEDLKRAGVEVTQQATADSLVLPSKPVARLNLGQHDEDLLVGSPHVVLFRLGRVGEDQKDGHGLGSHGGNSTAKLPERQQPMMAQAKAKTRRKSDSEDPGASGPPLRKKKRTNMQDMLQSFSG